MSDFIIKLLEIAHGQWLYRNFKVQATVCGILVTKKKEESQGYIIKKQKNAGGDGLLSQDKFQLKVILECLVHCLGARQTYSWLLSIQDR